MVRMLVLDDNRWLDLSEKESSEHSAAKDAEEDLFGSAEQSPYFHDSHRVTLRSENQQTESTANTRPDTGRSSSRRQAAADDSSSDEGNSFYQDDDENDATTELARQIRELTAMEEVYPTSRFKIAQHRPLGKIAPFRGKFDEGTQTSQRRVHGLPTESQGWCRILAQSSISKDDADLEFAEWQIYQLLPLAVPSISERSVLSSDRSKKENIRDYLNRLNGCARSANFKFKHSGREAKEHAKHFLETCGDRDLERQLTPMQLRDIHTLEDIVSAIQKVEKRMSSRSSSQSSSRCDDNRHS
ncbi:hypothetical protein PHMEG_00012346 [Phytophthora megakarya]|uniref:Eukaryotic/viral aspartic protease n=1 Tax=Phytophthora megakarya TaxID=4795 RepID=A0A225W9Y5_9STRA|nr:hypothetical protein PHMEG_00012346 [Phytophthora megakarya]